MTSDGQQRLVLHDVAAAIAAEQVETVYGVLGEGNLRLALALRELAIAWVSTRHEQEALAMADGAARRSGKLAVASVTHGPGLTNAISALTAAALGRSPVLLLLGDTPRTTRHHGQDVPQEPLVRATGAAWFPARLPATVAEDVAVAARSARADRRPAVLNLPVDLQTHPAAGCSPQPLPAVTAPSLSPTAAALDRLATLLSDAREPLLLAGRGATAAAADLAAVADATGARLGTTLLAPGLFRGHPAYLGLVGGFASPQARAALATTDVVVAFGASLNRFTTANGHACPSARWIQVEHEVSAVGHVAPPDEVVIADAALTAAALAARLAGQPRRPRPTAVPVPGSPPGRHTGRPPTGIDPRTVLQVVSRALPPRRGVVVGIGHYSGFAALCIDVEDPGDLVLPWQLGSVGLALPVGLGVAHVRPDRPTLIVEGDGGLLMNPAGLDTLARLDLPVLVLVLDDGAYGAEAHLLRRSHHDDAIARFPRRDVAALGRSLGVRAASAHTESELPDALATLLPITGPSLLHTHIDLEVIHDEVFYGLSG